MKTNQKTEINMSKPVLEKHAQRLSADQISFLKDIAKEAGCSITDGQAVEAHCHIAKNTNPDTADFYYAAKEYFNN